MDNRLHFVLATNRREFIGRIVESIYDCEPSEFEIRTHLLFQSDRTHRISKAFDKANEALDMIQSGWVWFQADDAYINPKLFRRISELIKENPTKECFVFSEEHREPEVRIVRAHPDNVQPNNISGGQFIIKRELIGDTRFHYNLYGELGDGYFIRSIFLRHPDKFMFIDEVLCSYDSYFWSKDEHSPITT